MHLLIAVPTYDRWEADFGTSLALTMADLARSDAVHSVRLSRCDSTIISEGRCDLVKDAIDSGADRILWMDTDMRFRPANVRALLAHDVDVVGVTYPKRRPPHDLTAQDMDGNRIGSGEGGLIEAAHIGLGLAVTRMNVFHRMPEPWFAFPWLEEAGKFVGEDVFFCRKARAHGIGVHVDPQASIGIGHVGKQVFEAS